MFECIEVKNEYTVHTLMCILTLITTVEQHLTGSIIFFEDIFHEYFS